MYKSPPPSKSYTSRHVHVGNLHMYTGLYISDHPSKMGMAKGRTNKDMVEEVGPASERKMPEKSF